MPAVFAVIGYGNTGKTTLIRNIIRELHQRNYKVAVIKHDPQDHGEVDKVGSDTYNFWEEGCRTVALSSPSRITLFRRTEEDTLPDNIIPLCGDVDFVILEGYKGLNYPKIEVRSEIKGTVPNIKNLLAIVIDQARNLSKYDKNHNRVPLFDRQQVGSLVDVIENSNLLKFL